MAKGSINFKALWKSLFNSNQPGQRRLRYADKGRDGYVIYKDPKGEISMYFEFGGGDCVAMISLPTEQEWTKQLKRDPAERAAFIQFTAEQATRDKAPGCRYRLSGNWIEIYK